MIAERGFNIPVFVTSEIEQKFILDGKLYVRHTYIIAGSCLLKYVCSRFIGDGVDKSMENSKQSASDDLQQVDVSCRPKLRPLPLVRQSTSRNKRRKKTSAPLPPTSSDENVFARPPAVGKGRYNFLFKKDYYQQTGYCCNTWRIEELYKRKP